MERLGLVGGGRGERELRRWGFCGGFGGEGEGMV